MEAMQRTVCIEGDVHPEHEESFWPVADALGKSDMVIKLEHAIDHTRELAGRVTAATIAHARRTHWLAHGLSRLIVRFPSQWSHDIERWKKLTPLMREEWKTEMVRQEKRGWWKEVAGKVEGFPDDPCVHHIHPLGWVDNFSITIAGNVSAKFERLAPIIFQHEGGYVDNLNDRGGATNMGIAWATWQTYAQSDLGIEPTTENLRKLSREQATLIYYKRYWLPSGIEDVHDIRLALMVYDWVITSGKAPREIQKVLNLLHSANVGVDNKLGPSTIQALNKAGPSITDDVAVVRKNYYRNLVVYEPANSAFIDGWIARVNHCLLVTL